MRVVSRVAGIARWGRLGLVSFGRGWGIYGRQVSHPGIPVRKHFRQRCAVRRGKGPRRLSVRHVDIGNQSMIAQDIRGSCESTDHASHEKETSKKERFRYETLNHSESTRASVMSSGQMRGSATGRIARSGEAQGFEVLGKLAQTWFKLAQIGAV